MVVLLISYFALTCIWSNAASIVTTFFTIWNANTRISWTVQESFLARAGIRLGTFSVDAGWITFRNTSMFFEYVSFLTTTSIDIYTRSVAAICDLRITTWYTQMIQRFLKSLITIAGVRSNARTIFTGSITNWSAFVIRYVPISRKTRTLSRTSANSKNTLRITYRNARIPCQPESLPTNTLIWSNTLSLCASSVANWHAFPVRILPIACAAFRHRFRLEGQFARSGGITGI